MVFQHYALYPHMTVTENMAFGLKNIGVSRDEIDRRIAEAARILEIASSSTASPASFQAARSSASPSAAHS